MANYCINCQHFFDSDNPKNSKIGTYGQYDICISKDVPVTDFIRGSTNPRLVNVDGKCSFYLEKIIAEVDKEGKIGT